MTAAPGSDITTLLSMVIGILHSETSRRAADMGLSRHEYAMVRELRLADILGERADGAYLRLRAGIPLSQVDVVANRLVQRGFIAPPGTAGEAWALTPEGDRLTLPLASIGESIVMHMTSGMTMDDVTELIHVLEQMRDN